MPDFLKRLRPIADIPANRHGAALAGATVQAVRRDRERLEHCIVANPDNPRLMRLPQGLLAESDAWERDGVITAEQRRAILARYDAPETGAQQASAALTWLALIVAGAGAVVLVAWNWLAIPFLARVLLTAGPMLGFYAAAAVAARGGRQARTEGFAVAAALFAGGVLFVTTDRLHVDPERTSTLLLWSAVLAATALLTPSAIAAGIGTAVAAWWILIGGGMPPPPWWFLPVWLVLALAVERAPNRSAAGGVTLAFGFWVFFVMLDVWNDQPAIPGIGVVLASNWLYTLSLSPAARRPAFARATPSLALTVLGLGLLLPSESHRAMTDWHLAADRIWPAVALLAALACGIGWNVWRSGAWRSRPAGLTAVAVLWLAAWFMLPAQLRAGPALQWIWTAVFSGAVVHLGAAAVRDAARSRDGGLSVVGLVSVLMFVVVRVADARSLVVSGLMLIASAALLWWLARLWIRPPPAGATP